MRNDARIYGSDGWILVESPWKTSEGSKMTLFRKGADPEEFSLGVSIDQLYAIEADTVAEHFEEGEVPFQTVQDTLNQMRALDMLRVSAGLKFEGELEA
jgi:predicted dehydrogenase